MPRRLLAGNATEDDVFNNYARNDWVISVGGVDKKGKKVFLRLDLLQPQIEEWEVAVMHRDHTAPEGACCRVTWIRMSQGDMDRAIEVYRHGLLPLIEQLPGFCGASMLISRETGVLCGTVSFDGAATVALKAVGPVFAKDGATVGRRAPSDAPMAIGTGCRSIRAVTVGRADSTTGQSSIAVESSSNTNAFAIGSTLTDGWSKTRTRPP